MRTVSLMNTLGAETVHTVFSLDGSIEAARRIASGVACETLTPPAERRAGVRFLARALKTLQPDVLLTYNWGAMDAVAAAILSGLRRVIHAEDGFGPDEAVRLKRRRVWARRFLLRRIHATVAPSRTLERIAREQYRLPEDKVRYIPNGVDTDHYSPRCGIQLRRRLGIPDDAVVAGYAGRLGAEKNLGMLLGAVRRVGRENLWVLLAGGGPSRAALEAQAESLGIGRRVVFAGQVEDAAPYYNAMDIFALSSLTEQMPLSLLEAMASGLPAVAAEAGDIALMLGDDARRWVVRQGDEAGLAAAIQELASDGELRAKLGARNRARVEREYSLGKMAAAYRRLYWEAAGRPER